MSSLHEQLRSLGLSQYLKAFVAEGFDTWDTLLDITESDLNALNVSLGHRRKLQRAIAESIERPQNYRPPISISKDANTELAYPYPSPTLLCEPNSRDSIASSSVASSTKRKYKRHAKPDENSPKRPQTAYVIFSNQVRQSLNTQDMTFSEIAKLVGKRWQMLPAGGQDVYHLQAARNRKKYATEMAEYIQTPEYEAYQKYLDGFKARNSL